LLSNCDVAWKKPKFDFLGTIITMDFKYFGLWKMRRRKTRTNLRDVKKHTYIFLMFQEPTALIIRDT
jgi:hypothetical protein